MIQHILILTTDGLPLVSRSYCEEEVQPELISGFLSAIDSFGQASLGQGISQVQLEDKYITIKREKDIMVMVISEHCLGSSSQDDCVCLPSVLQNTLTEFEKF